jgi:hypothetical protein
MSLMDKEDRELFRFRPEIQLGSIFNQRRVKPEGLLFGKFCERTLDIINISI